MVKYSSLHRFPSRVLPGVIIVVRKMSEGRRDAIQKALANSIDDISLIEAKVTSVRAEAGFHDEMSVEESRSHYAILLPDDKRAVDDAADEYRAAMKTLDRGYFDFGFVRVEDLDLDGVEAPTGDQIYDLAGPEFYKEVVETVRRQFQMSPEEREAFESLSTSGAAEDGKAQATTATSAENPAATNSGTAPSTSQS